MVATPLLDDEFHEVLVFRQRERHAADVSESIVQPVGDGEKRRGLIRKNVRAADHRKRDVILESFVIDAMGERQGRDDLPGFRILRILIKLDFLNDAGERRRGHFNFFALEQDAFRKKTLFEGDVIFLVSRPIVLRLEGELRIGNP